MLILLNTIVFALISNLHITTTSLYMQPDCVAQLSPLKFNLGVNHSNGPVVYSSVKCVPLQDQSEP